MKEINDLESEDKIKYAIPENYDFITARDLFNNPDVNDVYPKFEVKDAEIELLTEFLVTKKSFD